MVALSAQLFTESRLQQTVSPQVILQSQILELGAEDLRDRIEAELAENPALEFADEVWFLPPPQPFGSRDHEASDSLDRFSSPWTLADDLRLQLAGVSTADRELCEYLIECLDERGFLEAELAEVAALFGAKLSEVQAAVTALQSLEPAGIAARNLRECLLLQIERLPSCLVPVHAAEFVSRFLGTSGGSTTRVARQLRLSEGELDRLTRFIGEKLYMWPADRFRDEHGTGCPDARGVLPDAWILADGDGWRVQVAQSWSHSLRVSDAYARLERELCSDPEASPADRERIGDRVREARAFIHHLTRRESMLKRVTEAIVTCQEPFFTDGPQALVPLTRKEIAAFLGVHESTVSRITRDKYLQLPNEQLVSFDFFFDGSVSAKTVLRQLVEREDPRHPLADAVLAERLQAAGYPLARRTVAKYRDQMGIPAVHERRRN